MRLADLVFLTTDELLEIHAKALATAGGLDGVRDRGLLESAVAAPQRSAFGELTYPTIASMAAAMAFAFAKNHAFVDGNKRVAHMASRVFLEYNGFAMKVPQQWERVIEAVAASLVSQTALVPMFADTIGGDKPVET